MNRYQNLNSALDFFINKLPNTIHIYTYVRNGTPLFPNEQAVHQFAFSEEGKIRDQKLLKRDFSNTSVLYEYIKEEFLNGSRLTSIGYHKIKGKTNYQGIRLCNSSDNHLNLYFTKNTISEYQTEKKFYESIKNREFLEYMKSLIRSDQVDKLSFRSTQDERCSVVYIKDNEEYNNSLLKKRQLGYYYKKEKEYIDSDNLILIFNIICYFINYHLEENPQYVYTEDNRYQTNGLQIVFDSNKVIELKDPDLIYCMEKLGLIDELWKLQNKQIEVMPYSSNKILKKGEIKNGK